MVFPVYAVRDNKTTFAPQLIIQDNEQAAVRFFAYLVSNDKQVMGFSPFDYDLFQIGSFDHETGIIVPVTPIKFITNGGSAYEKPES